jgi:hypothetical protein
LSGPIKLRAEARGSKAIVSIVDGHHVYTSNITDVGTSGAGMVGLLQKGTGAQSYLFEARKSPDLVKDAGLQRELYDADGKYRGEWKGAGIPDSAGEFAAMDDWGGTKNILLDAYQPDKPPFYQDWVLVLEVQR